MKNLGIWLYRYLAIHVNHMLHHVLVVPGSMAPSPMYRPAFQRLRTPVPPWHQR
jgi:hypothetical protein